MEQLIGEHELQTVSRLIAQKLENLSPKVVSDVKGKPSKMYNRNAASGCNPAERED